MKIEKISIEEIKPYDNNAKLHPPEQIEQIKKSIEEFGNNDPIAIDENNVIIEVHGRYEALKQLGFNEAHIIRLTHLNEQQKKAYILAHNKLTMNTGFDFDTLNLELDSIVDFDMSDFGFEKLDFIDENHQEQIEDEIPNVPEKPKAKLGDIYKLGSHRLMCGDSTNIDDIKKLMNDEIADITFTSPPYNAGKTPMESKMQRTTKYNGNDDDKTTEQYLKFLNDYLHNTMIFSKYSFMNIQSISNNKIALIELLHKNQNIYADTIIWDKMLSKPAMAENVLNSEFEYIHIFSPKGNRAIGAKPFRGTLRNIIHFQKQTKNEYNDIHNATFPLEMALHFVENFSIDSVLDPLGGTGTTLIACEKLDRKCYMMELEPRYIDVIIDRWEKSTGKTAIKIKEGEKIE